MHYSARPAPTDIGATEPWIDFETSPERYRHWRLSIDGETAELILDVDENAPLFEGYQLKLNSYDLGVDIELADAIQRLRFEHPAVKVVILKSGKDRVFCAGANIRMLAGASHAHKVNFCKFTNETRNGIEDASQWSGQKYLCAIRGTAAGGGYELALAADRIVMADDGSSAVSLPEVPLLAVLPGTGGLTRVTDKRKVRRDLADVFCTTEEGVRGARAVKWRLIDESVPLSAFDAAVVSAARKLAETSDRPGDATGIELRPLQRSFETSAIRYSSLAVEIDRASRIATLTVNGPDVDPPASTAELVAGGDQFWPLRLSRELDDAILHLRLNERSIGTLVFRSQGDAERVLAHDAFLEANADFWLTREILNQWKRVLKRIDVTSRSLVAIVDQGSCFAGTLAEIVLACDRSFMLSGTLDGDNRPPATMTLDRLNFGSYPMPNGLTRLQTRFLGEPEAVDVACAAAGKPLSAEDCEDLGLITAQFDDIDWADEIRIFLEERSSFSADGLTGLEANLRFGGPETMESKIFGRLTAWQNWIFQRPNAVGADGALKRYGTGRKADFNPERV
ncbi:MAG: 2,3-epoxybenzoyl-CoA dihydrolase [Hyphomicrobiaceae bacterium]